MNRCLPMKNTALTMSSTCNLLVLVLMATFKDCLSTTRFVKQVQQIPIELQVAEEQPIGNEIGTLQATTDSNKVISYELDSKITHILKINNATGVITNIARLDAEAEVFWQFSAFASTSANDKATTLVNLIVNDVNDNTPTFSQASYEVFILENAEINSSVTKMTARDADGSDYISYSFTDGDHPVFSIRYDGKVTTKSLLDYETKKTYKINVTASDGTRKNYTMLNIKVFDFDDQGSVFERSIYNAQIKEGTYFERQFLTQVHAYDLDFGINASVVYRTAQANIGSAQIWIDSVTGEVYLSGTIDRENSSSIDIHVSAENLKHPAAQAIIKLKVVDINDNSPTFTKPSFTGYINENSAAGTPILRVTAYDRDEGNNSAIKFTITNIESVPFKITTEGEVQVNGLLDRETRDIYVLKVEVEEIYTIEKYHAETSVVINIIDTNDNTPEFAEKSVTLNILENKKPPVQLKQFTATDKDMGSNAKLLYSIKSTFAMQDFALNNVTGVLSTAKSLDREKISEYHFQVEVSDQASIEQKRTSTISVTIFVDDENDNIPLFEKSIYEAYIIEAVTPNTIVSTVTANDPDSSINGEITYAIVSGQNQTFVINQRSGVVRTKDYLDRETQDNYNLTISATDGHGKTSLCNLVVRVLDSNDNRPIFAEQGGYTFSVFEGKVNAYVGKIQATDADEGQAGLVTYSILDNTNFQVNSTTGDIYTLKSLDREKSNIEIFTIVATDSVIDYRSGYGQVRVNIKDVNDNAPIFKDKEYSLVIHKDTSPNTIIHTAIATDSDVGKNAEIKYKSDNLPAFLSLNSSSGELKLKSRIPSTLTNVVILVVAFNPNNLNLSGMVTITLLIQATLVDAPVFQNQVIQVHVLEGKPIGTLVTDLNATYHGKHENAGDFVYSIKHGGNGEFSINQQNGFLKTANILDREAIAEYTIIASVSLRGQDSVNFATIRIQVGDMNDNLPYFISNYSKLYIQENMATILQPPHIRCADADYGNNALTTYTVIGESPLTIDSSTGELNLNGPLDHEKTQEFNLTIKCENSLADVKLSATNIIRVMVQDENDNAPVFEKAMYHANVTENNVDGMDLITTRAADNDNGLNGRLHYSIVLVTPSSTCFEINARTGLIKLNCVLDREKHDKYQLQIIASDSGAPSLSTVVNLFVTVFDVNDNIPVLDRSLYEFTLSENRKAGVIEKIGITDKDSGPPCKHCVIHSGNDQGLFQISEDGSLLTLKKLDREINASHYLTMRSYHTQTHNTSILTFSNTTEYVECSIVITVEDENDNAPFFVESNLYIGVYDGSPYGTLLTTVSAIDYDETPGVLYNITSGNEDRLFTINGRTGEIKTTFRLMHIQKMRTLKIIAHDNHGRPPSMKSTNQLSINVLVFDNDALGSFTTTAKPGYIYEHIGELERLLSNLTKAHAKLHEVLPTSKSSTSSHTGLQSYISNRRS
ncbi:protocadherin Fat 4-like isoform X3 [Hydractinia symbiolongicarpus]|uniref:protocadherin Fat 4-like isoform X3 n=1 Tax=Hydractinia symbiolongicarpus TaxID=13093 RepID=UPI00254E161D|nr:protocadherin Fat 4-like isoform X3 [Hydractinia symbiolongicarpus]